MIGKPRKPTKAELEQIAIREPAIKLCWTPGGVLKSLCSNPAFNVSFVGVEYKLGCVTEAHRRSLSQESAGLFCYRDEGEAGAQLSILNNDLSLHPFTVVEVIPLGEKVARVFGLDYNWPKVYVKSIIKKVA